MKATFDLYASEKKMGIVLVPETTFEEDFLFRLSQSCPNVISSYAGQPMKCWIIGTEIRMEQTK